MIVLTYIFILNVITIGILFSDGHLKLTYTQIEWQEPAACFCDTRIVLLYMVDGIAVQRVDVHSSTSILGIFFDKFHHF